MKKHNFKEFEKIIINKKEYTYSSSYDRLEKIDDKEPAIICPYCFNDKFQISYGDWECIAVCNCGHRMVIYDG